MKIVAVICLVVLAFSSTTALTETRAFKEATSVGQGTPRWFFLFSTSTGQQYVIRQDGTGEALVNGRRRLFHLNFSPLERVYFGEYQGDVLLLCEGRNAMVRLVRMNPQTRKIRWTTRIEVNDLGSCQIETDDAHCGETRIDLKTGEQIN